VAELLRHLGGFYRPYAQPHRPRPRDVDELIDIVGLADKASAKVATLSGGERRRMDLAIGIIGRPDVLFLVALGVLATLPFGLMIGAVARDPRSPAQSFGLMSVVLIAISGIFYPISGMPGSLHPIAQIFPYYWLGLGMRSGLLPPTAATMELGGPWDHWQTAAVLGGWAIAGLLIAPRVLSTAARRESGASVEVGRRKAMQRTG
jgi:ABC-2 family transporter protein